jgi:small subunit ribosomal protein S15
MPLPQERKAEIVERFGASNTDTGSASVQIALLTERINTLQKHFEIHKKDHHGRQGLLRMVGRRRRMLEYLKSKSEDGYRTLIGSLGIRK